MKILAVTAAAAAVLLSTTMMTAEAVKARGRTLHVQGVGNAVKSQSCSTDTGCPDGPYISESDCFNCWVDGFGTLTCDCPAPCEGCEAVTSSLPNSWACSACISSVEGKLTCSYPSGAETNPYTEFCHACYMQEGVLSCEVCDNVYGPFSIGSAEVPACGACAAGVAWNSETQSLECAETSAPTATPTPQPTSPTSSPSLPTSSPTPAAGPACGGWWNPLNTPTGQEMAPTKPCGTGVFLNDQGCNKQNYCCWVRTSSTTGYCAVPNGVPVDCPTLSQGDCADYPDYCQWSTYFNSCVRICPGNPATMCTYN